MSKAMRAEHAATCGTPDKWVQTFMSIDTEGNAQAFEFRCTAHAVNFWLALPPMCSDCGQTGDGVDFHLCESCADGRKWEAAETADRA